MKRPITTSEVIADMSSRAPDAPSRCGILIASSDTHTRQRCCAALETSGFTVVEAESVFAASTVLAETPLHIDLLLLDAGSGHASVRAAIDELALRHARMMIHLIVERPPQGNFSGYAALVKPVDDRELLAAVRSRFQRPRKARPSRSKANEIPLTLGPEEEW